MQICNFVLNKKVIFACASIFFAFCVFAQSVSMPEMPQMPSMPTMPTVGGEFYRPTTPTSSVSQNSTSESSSSSTENSSTQSQNSKTTISSSNSSDILSSLLTNNSILSASDITNLYDSGLFNDLSLLNTKNANSQNSENLLQQILQTLEELKNQQKTSTAAEKQNLQNTQTDSQNFKSREPSVLRFKINGYDIKDSLSSVFFSEPDADGSFLLTGDRKYFTNQQRRTETFYLLFKTVKSTGSTTTFEVQSDIVQDFKNENSFVYKFVNKKNLTAEKTGNLVVLRLSDNDLNIDLLLDIDK